MLVALFLRQVVMQANARCAAGVVYPPGFALGLSTEQPPNATTAALVSAVLSVPPRLPGRAAAGFRSLRRCHRAARAAAQQSSGPY